MATYSKHDLSESTDGRGIDIAATATAGTLIHEATAVVADYDEVWLYASNDTASDEILVIEWGVDAQEEIWQTIAGRSGLALVIPGLLLQGNATELVVRGYNSGGASGRITVFGFVNRIDDA